MHDAALIAVRVVLGEPAFGLYFIEPSPLDTASLHEVLEATRDRIEEIVVEAYARERAA